MSKQGERELPCPPQTFDAAGPADDGSISIDDMWLTVRAYNGLYSAGLTTLARIRSRTAAELMGIPNFGHHIVPGLVRRT